LSTSDHPTRSVIFDLKRVDRVDITGAELIKRIVDQVAESGCTTRLSGLRARRGAREREMMAYLEDLRVLQTVGEENLHTSLDEALEAAEDQLLLHYLGEREAEEPRGRVRHCVLFDGLTDEEWGVIEGMLEKREYAAQEQLYTRGDPGDWLCILDSGHVSVFVTLADQSDAAYRMASFGPGRHFGDMSFLEGAPRTGTVIADIDTVLYQLSREDYTRLETEHPVIAFKILHGLAHRLSARLRVTSEELVEREAH
jgi:CRP-like cAMP-binding protein